jgi:hypothetical protein
MEELRKQGLRLREEVRRLGSNVPVNPTSPGRRAAGRLGLRGGPRCRIQGWRVN